MITDIDIKKQKIINLERSILLHTLNKSPVEKLQEIRDRIIELKNEISKEETDYYCAFEVKTPIEVTYQDGLVLRNQLRKLTVMSEAKVEELQRLWKAIYKEKNKKEKGMKILILEGLHGENKGEKMQWRLKRTNLKVEDRVVLNCHDWKVIKVVERKRKKLDPFIEKRRPKGVIFSEFATKPLKWLTPEFTKMMKSLTEKPNSIFFYHRKAGKNIGYQIAKEHMEKQALSEFRKRPYLKVIIEEVKGKPQGEENLEKIKFPCWCTHNVKTDGYSGYGMIITCLGGGINSKYMLIDIGKQRKELTTVASNDSLKKLIEIWDIEICKGETKLWKEVGEYTKKKE